MRVTTKPENAKAPQREHNREEHPLAPEPAQGEMNLEVTECTVPALEDIQARDKHFEDLEVKEYN